MDQNTIPSTSDASIPVSSSPIAPPQCSHHHEFQKYRELLDNASALIVQVRDALSKMGSVAPSPDAAYTSTVFPAGSGMVEQFTADRVVEGVFNGYAMIGDDTKQYPVPPNYASKSKLVEGDRLKLIIRGNGQFVYKQIGPVERERRVGVLESHSADGGMSVTAAGRTYRVLGASITYYHGAPGDEVVLLVPRGGMSPWAAVENIIKAPAAAPASPAPSSLLTIDPLDNDFSSLLPDVHS